MFTNEGIQEAMLPSPDNNMLINFLGTLEFLERSEVRGVQPDAGKLNLLRMCQLQTCGAPDVHFPHGRAPGGAFISQRSCLIPLEGL